MTDPVDGGDAQFSYVGSELQLFSEAHNWKRYYGSMIRPYLGERVLEVGAGLGGTTPFLVNGQHKEWVCLEPDPSLAVGIERAKASGVLPPFCRVEGGTISTLPKETPLFNSIVYIDVLEHIADDAAELKMAVEFLSPGGYICVISPAHQGLFSKFDEAVGHHRRYSKASFRQIVPAGLNVKTLRYLDSIGFFLSLANRLILKQADPTKQQIRFWDRVIVPVSKVIDPILGYGAGKSVLAILVKRA